MFIIGLIILLIAGYILLSLGRTIGLFVDYTKLFGYDKVINGKGDR